MLNFYNCAILLKLFSQVYKCGSWNCYCIYDIMAVCRFSFTYCRCNQTVTMSDYYIPQMNRKHSAASSQSSCDEDVTPATHSSNVSHESYMERSSNYYAPSSHRKRTVSSQSSQDSEVSPAKRRYTTSTSFEGNPETSSQSEVRSVCVKLLWLKYVVREILDIVIYMYIVCHCVRSIYLHFS